MNIYRQIYEFAASAGAFEGYVYRRSKSEMDTGVLSSWADNLFEAYHHLPADVISECQSGCDQTLGRAVKSLIAEFGEEHQLIGRLRLLVKDEWPADPDDFQKEKWFQK